MYEIMKKFLNDGGKCLLIENDKPIGVVLTVEEYEKLKNGKTAELPFLEPKETPTVKNSIGEERSRPWASAEIADIESTDDVTLEDLGIDELPY
ncbi:MAG: hypothetical protein AAB721_02315 [Patescibacteria group bacterium]